MKLESDQPIPFDEAVENSREADENVLQDVCDAFTETGMDSCYGDLEYVDFADTSKTARLWKSGSFDAGKFRWGSGFCVNFYYVPRLMNYISSFFIRSARKIFIRD